MLITYHSWCSDTHVLWKRCANCFLRLLTEEVHTLLIPDSIRNHKCNQMNTPVPEAYTKSERFGFRDPCIRAMATHRKGRGYQPRSCSSKHWRKLRHTPALATAYWSHLDVKRKQPYIWFLHSRCSGSKRGLKCLIHTTSAKNGAHHVFGNMHNFRSDRLLNRVSYPALLRSYGPLFPAVLASLSKLSYNWLDMHVSLISYAFVFCDMRTISKVWRINSKQNLTTSLSWQALRDIWTISNEVWGPSYCDCKGSRE